MKISKAIVIQTASDLADEQGMSAVSLKAVAEKLEIRTPSLYNHINSLEDLYQEIAYIGMEQINEQLTRAAIGKTKEDALRAISVTYFQAVIDHPGVYEIIQWATWHANDEIRKIFEQYQEILLIILRTFEFNEKDFTDILNLITGLLHGYTTMQLGYALKNPESAKDKLCDAIDAVLCGIKQKYNKAHV